MSIKIFSVLEHLILTIIDQKLYRTDDKPLNNILQINKLSVSNYVCSVVLISHNSYYACATEIKYH